MQYKLIIVCVEKYIINSEFILENDYMSKLVN